MNRLILVAVAAGSLAVVLHPARSEGRRLPRRVEPTHSVWDGVYTQAQAVAGDSLFTAHGCIKCHGMDLKGTDDGAALTGDDFFGDFENSTLLALFDQIRNSMPPSKPKSVPREEVTQLVAFILSRNHFPTGATPLTDDTTRLADIKLIQKNPALTPLPSNMTRTVDTIRIGDTLRVIETIYIKGKSGGVDTTRLNDLKIFKKHSR
jgi:hypothetical protein